MGVELGVQEIQLRLGLFFFYFVQALLQQHAIQHQLDRQYNDDPDGDVQQGGVKYICESLAGIAGREDMAIHIYNQRHPKGRRDDDTGDEEGDEQDILPAMKQAGDAVQHLKIIIGGDEGQVAELNGQ